MWIAERGGPLLKMISKRAAKPIVWMHFWHHWIKHNGLLMVPLTSTECFKEVLLYYKCKSWRDRSESRQREEHAILGNSITFTLVYYAFYGCNFVSLSRFFCGQTLYYLWNLQENILQWNWLFKFYKALKTINKQVSCFYFLISNNIWGPIFKMKIYFSKTSFF